MDHSPEHDTPSPGAVPPKATIMDMIFDEAVRTLGYALPDLARHCGVDPAVAETNAALGNAVVGTPFGVARLTTLFRFYADSMDFHAANLRTAAATLEALATAYARQETAQALENTRRAVDDAARAARRTPPEFGIAWLPSLSTRNSELN